MYDVELRWNEELPDAALVLRGGPPNPKQLWKNATTVVRECGYHGICVGAGTGSAAEVASGMPYRGKIVRPATVGDLRAAGLEVVRVQEHEDSTHAVVLLKQRDGHGDQPPYDDPDELPSHTDEIWRMIDELFGSPMATPHEEE